MDLFFKYWLILCLFCKCTLKINVLFLSDDTLSVLLFHKCTCPGIKTCIGWIGYNSCDSQQLKYAERNIRSNELIVLLTLEAYSFFSSTIDNALRHPIMLVNDH